MVEACPPAMVRQEAAGSGAASKTVSASGESGEKGGWWVSVSRLPLCRWLLQRPTSRVPALVVLALTSTVLLLAHTDTGSGGGAALMGHYSRLSSAARRHLGVQLPGRPQEPVEPLSAALCSPACPCACRPWREPHDADPPPPVISNCGPTADRRGAAQNVIAYTYFGTNVTAYLSGISANAMQALEFYPGWTVRIYHDGQNSFPPWQQTACEVTCKFPNVDLCDVRHIPGLGDISNQTATVWRFAVIADESVERFLMRDLDSILTQRERDAVNEWLESNKTFHLMRDHPYHGAEILAGMWGGWNRDNAKYVVLRRQMLESINPIGKNWWDQRLLRTVLWPELMRTGDVISHDSYQCMNFPFTQPFPTKRHNMTEFVGSQYTRNHITVVKECPMACRPRLHMDWKYC